MSSNLPEHPISSRDSGRSKGPAGGTSAERERNNTKSLNGPNKHNKANVNACCSQEDARHGS